MVCFGFISVCFLQVPTLVIGVLATRISGNREVPTKSRPSAFAPKTDIRRMCAANLGAQAPATLNRSPHLPGGAIDLLFLQCRFPAGSTGLPVDEGDHVGVEFVSL